MPNEIQILENRIKQLEEVLSVLVRSDRYTFQKDIQLLDGRGIQLAKGTGTNIGTASDQKLGLWGVTPVDQPETVSDASTDTVSDNSETTNNTTINSNFTATTDAINAIIDRLQEVGIIK